MSDRKRSKSEERSFARMLADLEEQEVAFDRFKRTRSLVPPGWHSVESRAEIKPKKTKLTVTLDADMVAWFRALGRGYQPRMNAVLRAYMHAVISKEVAQKGDLDCQGDVI
ncbi:MAG: BrnA antitoxin family protein [Proteobacteria bacterium]|nr:BrnA antitoxin family protein [Pseudomonadota bacterium]